MKVAFAEIAHIAPRRGEAKPFLKWVGGKRQIIPDILTHAPTTFGRYHEPFLGGGAVFFHLRRSHQGPAFLTDTNRRLIRAYRGVQQDVDGVIERLHDYEKQHRLHGKTFFMKVRQQHDIDSATAVEVAAWLIYLNKTAYNGLYRVNSRNLFNVPFGKYKNPTICDEDNLVACSKALKNAELDCLSFEEAARRVRRDDFVYFDPPYVPLTATSNFTDYTSEGFGDHQQVQLSQVARELKKRGAWILLSNSSAERVKELYQAKTFTMIPVQARRLVNSKASARGHVPELLIK